MIRLLSIVGLFISATVSAKPIEFKDSEVSFKAKGTPFISIDGTGGKLTGTKLESDGTTITGETSVTLKTITTDMDLRDEHMRGYLGTDKYPEAKLSNIKANGGTFTGDLFIKGETKPVKGTYKLTDSELTASFKITLKDFPAIGSPSYSPTKSITINVADDVDVTVTGKIK